MKRTTAIVALLISVILLAAGLLFVCAATQQPSRLLLAGVLLAIGGGTAAWSGITLRRLRDLDPENLSDRITRLARAGGNTEVTLSHVVADLNVPDEAVMAAFDLLEQRGQCHRERRDGQEFYVFPGLKPSKVARRCPYCGGEFSVKTPLYQCPHCGGNLRLERE